jgi:hypothetical protein
MQDFPEKALVGFFFAPAIMRMRKLARTSCAHSSSIDQSITQSMNQPSIKQSINERIIQSIGQSVNHELIIELSNK